MKDDLKFKIKECTSMIDYIEQIEFRLMDLGMTEERKLTRLIKRGLIYRQTELWRELEEPPLPLKKKAKK